MVNYTQSAQFTKKSFEIFLPSRIEFFGLIFGNFKPPKNILNLCCRELKGNWDGNFKGYERLTLENGIHEGPKDTVSRH